MLRDERAQPARHVVAILEVLGVNRTAVDRIQVADRRTTLVVQPRRAIERPAARTRAARRMKSAQIGKRVARPVGVGAIVFGWSKPTHTPTTMDDEKPTNQASLKSSVVPVLPPAGNAHPAARQAPRAAIDDVARASRPSDTPPRATARPRSRRVGCNAVLPSASTTRVMSRGRTAKPPLGNAKAAVRPAA